MSVAVAVIKHRCQFNPIDTINWFLFGRLLSDCPDRRIKVTAFRVYLKTIPHAVTLTNASLYKSTIAVGTVGKISTFLQQGPQFDPSSAEI